MMIHNKPRRRFNRSQQVSTLLLCVLLMASLAFSALAVDKGKTSYTAEAVCAFRSIAALDPDPKTRNPDELAKHFVNPEMVGRFPGLGLKFDAAKVAMDMMDSGVFYYVNARTHHMDRLLKQALDRGATQVVILGAGFDSRAYRFHDRYPKVRFFEIDLPATSKDKQKRVKTILGKTPDWVSFVPIDFNTQTLDEVLTNAGFQADQQTFYVWEGVTYFISEEGVNNTLDFIANHSAPGSQLVFDYMLQRVVQGMDYSPYGSRRTVFYVSTRGEPYIFGIAPAHLEPTVNRHGLALKSDLGPADLSQRYLMDSQGKVRGKISEFLRIAHLEIPPPPQQQALKTSAGKVPRPQPAAAFDLDHRVPVPKDVGSFLARLSDYFLAKDLEGLMTQYSDRYLRNGRTKADVKSFLRQMFRRHDFKQHKIVLTRFEQQGNQAIIDGFIARDGFRTPILTQHIVREKDGHWRWYGNHK